MQLYPFSPSFNGDIESYSAVVTKRATLRVLPGTTTSFDPRGVLMGPCSDSHSSCLSPHAVVSPPSGPCRERRRSVNKRPTPSPAPPAVHRHNGSFLAPPVISLCLEAVQRSIIPVEGWCQASPRPFAKSYDTISKAVSYVPENRTPEKTSVELSRKPWVKKHTKRVFSGGYVGHLGCFRSYVNPLSLPFCFHLTDPVSRDRVQVDTLGSRDQSKQRSLRTPGDQIEVVTGKLGANLILNKLLPRLSIAKIERVRLGLLKDTVSLSGRIGIKDLNHGLTMELVKVDSFSGPRIHS